MNFLFYYLNEVMLFSESRFFITVLIYFFFLFLYSVFSIPGLVIFIALSGYLFGIYYSYLISIIAITLGSLVFFLFSKFFFKYFFLRYYQKYSQNIDKYISKSTTEYIIIFRMIPGPPLMLQNLILSILNISTLKFFFTTLVGFTPIIFMTGFIGNKIRDIQLIKQLSISDILSVDFLFVISLIILLLIVRIKYKNNKN